MKSLISPFLSSACALIACLVSQPVQATPLLTKDSNPQICKWIQNDTVTDRCGAFELTRLRYEEGSSIVILAAKFSFNGYDVTLLLNDNPSTTVNDPNAGKLHFHGVVVGTIEGPNISSKTIPGEGATCGISESSETVVCKTSNFSLLYIGKSNQSQQNSTSDQQGRIFKTKSYVDTGISLKPGDRITVNVSGTINFGLFTGSSGPEGIWSNTNYNYFTDLPHGHLLGRIYRPGMGEFEE